MNSNLDKLIEEDIESFKSSLDDNSYTDDINLLKATNLKEGLEVRSPYETLSWVLSQAS